MRIYQKHVNRGIKWLDKNCKKGWRKKIEWSKFCITSACRCILGQIEGNFFDSIEKHNLSKSQAEYYGFHIEPDPFNLHYDQLVLELGKEWHLQIKIEKK